MVMPPTVDMSGRKGAEVTVIHAGLKDIRGWGYLGDVWDGSAPRFSTKRFQLHALGSRKNGGVVRAPKEVHHKLQAFVELLYGGVCRAVTNTPLVISLVYNLKPRIGHMEDCHTKN
jgi:hypothetical protein